MHLSRLSDFQTFRLPDFHFRQESWYGAQSFESGLLIRNLRTMMGRPPQTQAAWRATLKVDGIKLSRLPRCFANQSHYHMPQHHAVLIIRSHILPRVSCMYSVAHDARSRLLQRVKHNYTSSSMSSPSAVSVDQQRHISHPSHSKPVGGKSNGAPWEIRRLRTAHHK